MDAIVLAAGKGTRMAPLTPELAKPLMPVAGRPVLHWMLDGLAEAGVTRVLLVVHHKAAEVEASARTWGGNVRIEAIQQPTPHGTGHAVAHAATSVTGDALLVMGDCLVDASTLQALAQSTGFAVAAKQVPDPQHYGSLSVDGSRVRDLVEKSATPPSNLVNAGLYKVPHAALQETLHLKPSPRGELEFTDIVRAWAKAGKLAWIPADGWLDLGAPGDLLVAQETMLPRRLDALLGGAPQGGPGTIETGVQVRGRLFVGEGAVVKSGVYVEGDVLVGAGARVGPNCYLRGPIAVGAGCHVGASTEIKASLLMDGANAPHLNYVGDSVLGPNVNLGAGTKVANLKVTPTDVRVSGPNGLVDTKRRKFGVVLGAEVKIGINCSLNPGTMVGARALIGAGRVIGGWVAPDSRLL